jgi:hypothetical protein
LKDVHTKWVAGTVAEAGWMVGANHGGGYIYSLCPKVKGKPLTEECFTNHTLAFVGKEHTIRYLDGARAEIQISALEVSDGTYPPGSAWRAAPIPACNCDYGRQCVLDGTGEPRAYGNETPPSPANLVESCATGTQFPVKFDYGYGAQRWNEPWGSRAADAFVIVDQLRVPDEVGEVCLS